MKDYNDYMDGIKVDEALHEKIMERAAHTNRRYNRNPFGVRFTVITACAAVLLFCVITIPTLFKEPIGAFFNNAIIRNNAATGAGDSSGSELVPLPTDVHSNMEAGSDSDRAPIYSYDEPAQVDDFDADAD